MSKLGKLSIKYSKNLGMVSIVVLLAIHIYAIIMNVHMPILNWLSMAILVLALYMMTFRVKHINLHEKIAKSVLKFSRMVLKVENRMELYDAILKEIIDVIQDADKGSIISLDQDELIFEAVYGYSLDQVRQVDLKLEDTFLYVATKGKLSKSVLVEDIVKFNKGKVSNDTFDAMVVAGIDKIKSTISVPILMDDQLIGMINVDSMTRKGFNRTDIDLVEYYALEVSKVIKLYQMFSKTLKSAKYDHLTNALSRGNFMTIVDGIIQNEEAIDNFSLVYYDLDKLKIINDQYGHDVGDQYIKSLVSGIQANLSGEEIISRFGGDEFVALLFRDDLQDYHKTCEDWFDNNPLMVDGDEIYVSYSYGSADYPSDGVNITDLINLSDKKMYEQKQYKRRVEI